MKSSGKNISLTSYDDIFSTEESRAQEQIQHIRLNDLVPFKDHPFRVVDDDRMIETAESIKEYGVLVPIMVRPMEDGTYEIISGHRRKRACELAGIDEIPAIIRNMDDDEATIIMVDSNLQRENILPSERAKAYQMKLTALQHRAGRPTKDNFGQVGQNYQTPYNARNLVAEDAGDSPRNVQRFIRLNSLEQPLMDKVDHGELAFTPAVELSYLKPVEQEWVQAALETTQQTPSLSQAQRMKKASKEGTLTEEEVMDIMSEDKKTIPFKNSVVIPPEKLSRYFPPSYTPEQVEKAIIAMLDARQAEKTISDVKSVSLPTDKLLKYFPKSYTPEQIQTSLFKLLESWHKKRQMQQQR